MKKWISFFWGILRIKSWLRWFEKVGKNSESVSGLRLRKDTVLEIWIKTSTHLTKSSQAIRLGHRLSHSSNLRLESWWWWWRSADRFKTNNNTLSSTYHMGFTSLSHSTAITTTLSPIKIINQSTVIQSIKYPNSSQDFSNPLNLISQFLKSWVEWVLYSYSTSLRKKSERGLKRTDHLLWLN